MNRWATCFFLSCFIVPTAASAATPIPKRKPILSAGADPQSAITRLVNGGETMDGSVVAYAPANGPSLERAGTSQSALYVVGKLADNGGPIGDGLVWRVFRDFPDANGELPLVHKGRGGDLELRLKPGRYIVHVSYGRAAVSRVVNVQGSATSETFILNAGGLQLNAQVDGIDTVDPKHPAKFEVYALENDEKRLIGDVRAGAIARLPAGNYHIVSKYGNVNAVRTADVLVEAGKLTRVSLRHQAGEIRLKLVRNSGGEAIADTAWTVYNGDGQEIFERVGAHANVTLAAGEYAVVAKHRDTEFRQSFTVSSGQAADVTVLAQQLSSPL